LFKPYAAHFVRIDSLVNGNGMIVFTLFYAIYNGAAVRICKCGDILTEFCTTVISFY